MNTKEQIAVICFMIGVLNIYLVLGFSMLSEKLNNISRKLDKLISLIDKG